MPIYNDSKLYPGVSFVYKPKGFHFLSIYCVSPQIESKPYESMQTW
ncbi:hypothetical protein SOVF_110220 [Spinacia oleracea]|nr:hypothetical protein SOVF_110220 [Spinacia oleracea]